ncbi:MAG TPA: hypothetical protein PK893_04275 [Candidatus Competibacteraceae bacterium]|nr:hypothetical protein [Candidatus Competibacteraceae bacterium]HQD55407.1 hypothetical protein [Candidatus Competibacteraceae bacterium]
MLRIFLIGVIALFPLLGSAAVCATVDGATSALIIVSTPVGECTGYVVLDVLDWPGASVWAMPTVEELSGYFFAGFSIPLSIFLFAWGVFALINVVKRST